MIKAKTIEELLKELEDFSDAEMIQVNLKQLLLIYKGVEDWRQFFHHSVHAPDVEEVADFVGSLHTGMYPVLNHIYIHTFNQLLSSDGKGEAG